jgi:hypothetical protein
VLVLAVHCLLDFGYDQSIQHFSGAVLAAKRSACEALRNRLKIRFHANLDGEMPGPSSRVVPEYVVKPIMYSCVDRAIAASQQKLFSRFVSRLPNSLQTSTPILPLLDSRSTRRLQKDRRLAFAPRGSLRTCLRPRKLDRLEARRGLPAKCGPQVCRGRYMPQADEMVARIMAVVAEDERKMISKRTKDPLAAARLGRQTRASGAHWHWRRLCCWHACFGR